MTSIGLNVGLKTNGFREERSDGIGEYPAAVSLAHHSVIRGSMKKLDLIVLRVQEHLHEEQDWNCRLRDVVQDEECEELHDCDWPARSQS
jgi:hypothetical protein